MRRFLGLTNYFRRFIHQYAQKAKPLTRLTKKGVTFRFGDEEQKAFDVLKEALTSPPVLALPDFTKPFEVICDASQVDIGAILLQEDKPIAYESRLLSAAERNYPTHDREALAVYHQLYVQTIGHWNISMTKDN